MKSIGNQLAIAIQDLRRQRKLSQQELADGVGVTRATISNIERATQSLSLDLFIRIANRLSIDPPQLLERALRPSTSVDFSHFVPEDHLRRLIEDAIS